MSDHFVFSVSLQLQAGSTARASLVNAAFQAVETAFSSLEAEIDASIASLIAGGVAFSKLGKTEGESPYSVQSTDLVGTYCITNAGASAEVVCNLPAGGVTDRIAFYVAAAYNLKVAANGAETIRYRDGQTAGGGYVQSSTVGTFWVLEFINGEWVVTELTGQLAHAGGVFFSSLTVQQAKTGNYALTTADLYGNTTFTNDGATGEINFTWPALSAGQKAKFIVVDANYLKITAPAGKKFRYLDTQGAAAGYIRSNVVGNWVICEATEDDIVIGPIGGVWNYDE